MIYWEQVIIKTFILACLVQGQSSAKTSDLAARLRRMAVHRPSSESWLPETLLKTVNHEAATRRGRTLPSEEQKQSRVSSRSLAGLFTPINQVGQRTTSGRNFLEGPESGTTFTSPYFPVNHGPYGWTTWEFQPLIMGDLLHLSCDVFRLGPDDLLIISQQGVGFKQYTNETTAPNITASTRLTIQLRTNRLHQGLVRCMVSHVSNSSGMVGPTPPTPTTVSTTTAAPEPLQCGIGPLNSRINGGGDAPPLAYRWMVALEYQEEGEPFCGGSIISDLHVVTAAHCVKQHSIHNLTLLVGKNNRGHDPNQMKFGIKSIRIHPKYDESPVINDIAILELSHSLRSLMTENGLAWPICLPERACNSDSGHGCFLQETVTVAGWGLLSESGPYPEVLQRTEVPVVPNCLCHHQYYDIGYNITNNMLCAGEAGKDACRQDSGGPAMWQQEEGWPFVLAGVVSFGKGCGRKEYPGVYTRVSEYLDWIHSILAEVETIDIFNAFTKRYTKRNKK